MNTRPSNTPTPVIRIVDDDDDLRDALAFMLRQEGWEVRAYASGFDYLQADSDSRPGCLILDMCMPEMSGLRLLEELQRRRSRLPVIFLSAHGCIELAVRTLHQGACDFLEKPIHISRLCAAIERAMACDRDSARDNDANLPRQRYASLSRRESEVLHAVVKDLSNRAIGELLGISSRTVEVHRAAAFHKLGVRNTAEAKRLAASLGTSPTPAAANT